MITGASIGTWQNYQWSIWKGPEVAMSADSLNRIREAVRHHVARLGAPPDAPIFETMLIRNGLYCGRRFECGSYQVVWFIEEDELKFCGPCGDVIWVASASQLASEACDDEPGGRHAA